MLLSFLLLMTLASLLKGLLLGALSEDRMEQD